LEGSLVLLTQVSLQQMPPLLPQQVPAQQEPSHTLPQLPQWVLLVLRLTHE
jgi:hypothetical protein